MADDWELDVHHNDGARRISLYVETDQSQPPGSQLDVQYDCANFARPIGAMPRVSLSVRRGRAAHRVRSAQCNERLRSRTAVRCCVVANGVQPGARVEYQFVGLQLACDRWTEDGHAATDRDGSRHPSSSGSRAAPLPR